MADPGLEGYGEGIVHMYLYNMYNAGMDDTCDDCGSGEVIWRRVYGKFKRVCTECNTIIGQDARQKKTKYDSINVTADPIDIKQWNKRARDTIDRLSKKKFYS